MAEHKHGTSEPCFACFRDYLDRNGGVLKTSPIDMPSDEQMEKIEEKIRAANSMARSAGS